MATIKARKSNKPATISKGESTTVGAVQAKRTRAASKQAKRTRAASKQAEQPAKPARWNPKTLMDGLGKIEKHSHEQALALIDKSMQALASVVNRQALADDIEARIKAGESCQTRCKWINQAWLAACLRRKGHDDIAVRVLGTDFGDDMRTSLPLFQGPSFLLNKPVSEAVRTICGRWAHRMGGAAIGDATGATDIAVVLCRAAAAAADACAAAGTVQTPGQTLKANKQQASKTEGKQTRKPRAGKVKANKPADKLAAFIADDNGPSKFADNVIKDLIGLGHAVDADPTLKADLQKVLQARFVALAK